MPGNRKAEAESENRVVIPVSFADYAGAWREGRGISVEEIDAYMRWLRGNETLQGVESEMRYGGT